MKEMELNGYMCGYHTRLTKIASMEKQAYPDWVEKALKSSGEKLTEAKEWIKEHGKQAYEGAKEKGSKAYESAKEKGSKAYESAKEGGKAAWETAKANPKTTGAILGGTALAAGGAGYAAGRYSGSNKKGHDKEAGLKEIGDSISGAAHKAGDKIAGAGQAVGDFAKGLPARGSNAIQVAKAILQKHPYIAGGAIAGTAAAAGGAGYIAGRHQKKKAE